MEGFKANDLNPNELMCRYSYRSRVQQKVVKHGLREMFTALYFICGTQFI